MTSLGSLGMAGIDLRSAPAALSAQVALTPEAAEVALAAVAVSHAECLLLSTCHRLELYWAGPPDTPGDGAAALEAVTGVPARTLAPLVVERRGEDAIRHLFRVAAGLESSALGEHEVLGQVGAALESAVRSACAGPVLGRVARDAVTAGRRARAETSIARSSLSLSGAALELAAEVLPGLGGVSALVVGSGVMAAQALQALRSRGIATAVVGRTEARAEHVASEHGAVSHPWRLLGACITRADIVVVATGADQVVVDADLVTERDERPLVLIDMSVPPNVEPGLGGRPGVTLFGLDQVSHRCARNNDRRRGAVAEVEFLIQAAVASTVGWCHARDAAPLITELQARFDAAREREVSRALEALPGLDERERDVVRSLAARLTSQLLHAQLARLREPGGTEGVSALIESLAAEAGR
ncbi:MAG: glutamyl-tRNA reductase [Candidatus Dormibacteria bacterium]